MTISTLTATKTQTVIELRDYQQAMRREVYQHIRDGQNRILAVVIMGAGKTYLSAAMLHDAVSKGHQCLFLVKLNVLIDQTLESLEEFGIHATALQGDRPVDPNAPVLVASLQTIAARVRRGASLDQLIGRPRLIVGDEAHILSFDRTYLAIEEYGLGHGATLLGLTATPWRRSRKEWLGMRFDVCVEGPQPPEIIKRGKALPCRGFTIGGVLDLDTLTVRAGEFVDSDISTQASRPEALAHVVGEWKRLCGDRPSMMVGATVAQAEAQAAAFCEAGVTAEVIVGSTSGDERKAIFRRVQSGETMVICSVGCLTAGFNLPCLSAILYVRATKSKALFHQTAGRGSRPFPGKDDYLLLDFGGNLKSHGNPMSHQDYDISEPKPIEVASMTKTCFNCGAEISNFARICPECGAEFGGDGPEDEQLEIFELAQLSEFGDKVTREKYGFIRRQRHQAFKAGLSPDLPLNRFHDVFGHNPPAEWMQGASLRHSKPSQKRKLSYLEYLERHCLLTGDKADRWFQFHWSLEFGPGASLMDAGLFDPRWHLILGVDLTSDWATIKAAYREAVAATPQTDVERLAELNSALEDATHG
jgi:superfamily II DNA or RNA helicase